MLQDWIFMALIAVTLAVVRSWGFRQMRREAADWTLEERYQRQTEDMAW
jgi:hypothetical protein